MKSLKIFIAVSVSLLIALPCAVWAAQFDAPFYDLQKRKQKQWAKEDKQIDKKLKALRKKFGKRPNIIYILADDVGWGVLAMMPSNWNLSFIFCLSLIFSSIRS